MRERWHEGGVQLAAVRGPARILEVIGEVERENVYGEDAGPPCAQRRQRFLVGVVPVRGKDNEGVHTALFPGAEQVVHPAVQRLASHRGVARIWSLRDGIDTVCDRRRTQNTEIGRKIIRQPRDRKWGSWRRSPACSWVSSSWAVRCAFGGSNAVGRPCANGSSPRPPGRSKRLSARPLLKVAELPSAVRRPLRCRARRYLIGSLTRCGLGFRLNAARPYATTGGAQTPR